MRHSDQLDILAESTAYPDKRHGMAVPYRQATYEFLAEQGAKGQTPVRKPLAAVASGNETLHRRQSKRSLIMLRGISH